MKKRFLVISPHPDDAELGMGGTIIKLKQQAHKVFLVDLTNGEPTPFGTPAKRQRETQRANKFLKIDERVNLGLENRYLFDTKRVRFLLAEKIRIFKPDILFCPYPEDAHPDHIATTHIAEAARFYAKFTKLNLKGKPHYPFYLFYFFCSHLRTIPKISFLIDISLQFKEKQRTMNCYRSQFVDNPKSRFILDYVKSQNHYFGQLIHSEFAEAFYSKELLKIGSFEDLL